MSWYYEKSKYNKDTADYLYDKTPNHMDWEVVVIFYAAIHLINYKLEKKNKPVPKRHETRLESVERFFPEIASEYHTLYSLSRAARYCNIKISKNSRDFAKKCLSSIESQLEKRG